MSKAQEIAKIQQKLGISLAEATQLWEDDNEVDKMTVKECQADLSAEQKKAVKDVSKTTSGKPTVYKLDKRTRKENPSKRELIEKLRATLTEWGCENVEVTNVERELTFVSGDVKYKLVMSVPRS